VPSQVAAFRGRSAKTLSHRRQECPALRPFGDVRTVRSRR
jgi:hypothetical protein